MQPSSVDVRLDRLFRVFRNHTAGVIDVKQDLSELTELVELGDDGVFMLHPGEFVLGSTLERVAVPDNLVARIEGKALSIATLIPTPDGWTTMGDIRVGDAVFTHTGRQVRVTAATDVMVGRPCFEITFSDRSTMIADASHQWLTTSKAERVRLAPPSVKTTEQIAARLRVGDEHNHHIHLTASVQCAERDLPIDPYVARLRHRAHPARLPAGVDRAAMVIAPGPHGFRRMARSTRTVRVHNDERATR